MTRYRGPALEKRQDVADHRGNVGDHRSAEFRFEGDEVEIRRDAVTGDVVLSKPLASWDEYFDWVRTLDLPSDFLRERDQPEDDLRDPMSRHRHG